MRLRRNGGITVCGLRLVSSEMIAISSTRSGKRCFMSCSGGPTLPGESPPLMSWQVRQLPLARSKASCSPGEGAGAAALAAEIAIPRRSTGADRVRSIALSLFRLHLVERTGGARGQVLAFRGRVDPDRLRIDAIRHAFLRGRVGPRILPDEHVAIRHL